MLKGELGFELHVKADFSDRVFVEELVNGELLGNQVVIGRQFGTFAQIFPFAVFKVLVHH